MSEKQYALCQKCLENLAQEGLLLASYYQEICLYFAELEKPYQAPRIYRPMTSQTMIEYMELKGYLVTTEVLAGNIDRLLVKPRFKEENGITEFCACK